MKHYRYKIFKQCVGALGCFSRRLDSAALQLNHLWTCLEEWKRTYVKNKHGWNASKFWVTPEQIRDQAKMLHRSPAGAAAGQRALCALCASLMLGNAYGVVCSRGDTVGSDSTLPCSFGGCKFSKDASGFLVRTGACPTQTGALYLNNRGIKGLREDVFSNMGACW
jgi:hypothetical protein